MPEFYFDPQGMWDWAYAWTQRSDCAYDGQYRNYQQRPSDGKWCFDCSSFTFFACWLGGGLDVGSLGYNNNLADYQAGRANAWNVTMMINSLRYAGWEQYNPRTDTWQFGDILALTHTHCEIFYQPNTYTMGAVNPSRGITITDYSRTYYDLLLRPPGSSPGPTPPWPGPSRPVPIWLIKRAQEIQKGW